MQNNHASGTKILQLKINLNSLSPGLVASYDLQPGGLIPRGYLPEQLEEKDTRGTG